MIALITELTTAVDPLFSVIENAIIAIGWDAVVFVQATSNQHRSKKSSEESKQIMTQFHRCECVCLNY
jgi:hypothetical protein